MCERVRPRVSLCQFAALQACYVCASCGLTCLAAPPGAEGQGLGYGPKEGGRTSALDAAPRASRQSKPSLLSLSRGIAAGLPPCRVTPAGLEGGGRV